MQIKIVIVALLKKNQSLWRAVSFLAKKNAIPDTKKQAIAKAVQLLEDSRKLQPNEEVRRIELLEEGLHWYEATTILNDLAINYAKIEETDKAFAACDRLIELSDYRGYLIKGDLFNSVFQDTEKASSFYRLGFQQSNENSIFLVRLGNLYFHARRFEDLKEVLASLEKTSPLWVMYFELCMVSHLNRHEDHSAAWELLRHNCRNSSDPKLLDSIDAKFLFHCINSKQRDYLLSGKMSLLKNVETNYRQVGLYISIIRALINIKEVESAEDTLHELLLTLETKLLPKNPELFSLYAAKLLEISFLVPSNYVTDSIQKHIIPNTYSLKNHLLLQKLLSLAVKNYIDKDLVISWLEFLNSLRDNSLATTFDLRNSQNESNHLFKRIKSALSSCSSLSILRIGDGEAYGFRKLVHDVGDVHRNDDEVRELHWWGQSIEPNVRLRLCDQFTMALSSADIIGIPTGYRIARDLQPELEAFQCHRWGRGLQTVFSGIRQSVGSGKILIHKTEFTDERFHQTFFSIDNISKLSKFSKKILVISCFDAQEVEGALGLNISSNFYAIQIPAHSLTRNAKGQSGRFAHTILPDYIDTVEKFLELHVEPGTMVLVGAGFAGKWFLHKTKELGGVALDVGAVIDYWHGHKTRSLVDM